MSYASIPFPQCPLRRSFGLSAVLPSCVALTLFAFCLCTQAAQAQGERQTSVQKLEALDQEGAIEVMRAAIEGVYRDLPSDRSGRASGRSGTYLANSVRVLPAGLWSDAPHQLLPDKRPEPVPEEVEAVAERLAATLGVAIGSFSGNRTSAANATPPYTDEDSNEFVAASAPEIRGSEAHVEVRQWDVLPGVGHALNIYKVDLERRRKKGKVSWQVARVSNPITLDYWSDSGDETPGATSGQPEQRATERQAGGLVSYASLSEANQPKIVGGYQALYKALRYPETAPEADGAESDATVFVRFTVGTDGRVRDNSITVQRSPHEVFSEEVERVLREEVRFEPGRQNGEAVPVYMSIAVPFDRVRKR